MFDREFTIIVFDIPQVLMWLKRSARYFPYIEKRLKLAGLRDDLKYLAVAESSLHTHVKSKSGAVGMWQLMPDTAKRYGLKVARNIDERLCYLRSTDAAIDYFNYLKTVFDSWLLIMSAYNCGERGLHMESVNQGQENYFKLNLPRETERYIFRIAAIKTIMENPEKYGFIPIPERFYKPEIFKLIKVDINKRYSIYNIAKVLGLTYKKFKELNPKLLTTTLPKGKYTIKLMPEFNKNFETILTEVEKMPRNKQIESFGEKYTVQRGDILSEIAWETGVSVYRLKKLNKLRKNIIYPGQILMLQEP